MWLLSYFKRSVGNCHSALRRGIQYEKHKKNPAIRKIRLSSLDSASERGMTVTNRLFEIQNHINYLISKKDYSYIELTLIYVHKSVYVYTECICLCRTHVDNKKPWHHRLSILTTSEQSPAIFSRCVIRTTVLPFTSADSRSKSSRSV